jgi:haloalkane dehalogenase
MRQAFADPATLTPAIHAHYLKPLATPADRQGCLVFPRQIINSTAWLEKIWSSIELLRDKPTLIVWGMKDIAFREKELRRWQQAFPRADTLRLAPAGHYVPEEAPDELAEAAAAFFTGKGAI